MLESTKKFTGERYEMGMLWSEPEPNLPNKYSSALGQLYSLERRFQRDPNLKMLYQQSIEEEIPSTIISDNGTNFVGAERKFAEYIVHGTKEGSKNIQFNEESDGISTPPQPATRHFDGLWERLVRSCKKAMYAVLGNRSVTEDVLSTTMCFVEQTSNARPSTPVQTLMT